MSDARHHRAGRDGPVVIFVPVPFESGSPKQKYQPPPGQYKRNQPEHWQPRTRPPTKSEKVANFLDGIARNGAAARDHMDFYRRLSAEKRREQQAAP